MNVPVLLTTLFIAVEAVGKVPVHTLPAADAKRWIAVVQAEKTGDGGTILQVLEHAQRLRPAAFKFGQFEIGYSTVTGEPDAVTVETWIGARQAQDEVTKLMIPVKQTGVTLTVAIPRVAGPLLGGLRRGRDALVQAVDREYQDLCIDHATNAKQC